MGVHKNISRGQHAHFKTKQYLIAINGSCSIRLNNGINETTYKLCKPNVGVFQDLWFGERCMIFHQTVFL